MADNRHLDEDELITRRALRSVRKAAPIAVVLAALAFGAVFFTQDVGDSTWNSEVVVELTDSTATGITVNRGDNNALQEIEAQLLTLESATFRTQVQQAMGDLGSTLVAISASNREDTPVLIIDIEATTPEGAELAAQVASDTYLQVRVDEANESLERELAPLRDQREQQLQVIDDLSTQLDAARPTATADQIAILESRTASALERLADYDRAIQEREFLIVSAGGEVRVVSPATSATELSQSALMRPLQVAVLVLVLALIAAVVISRVRGKLNLLDDVRAVAGPDVPILSTVPEFRSKFRKGSDALVVGRRNARREAEAFRYLRSAIEVATEGQTPLVVAFTSANAQEGKSTTAGNYALAMARAGRSTALLDGDLLNSTVSKLFDAQGDNAFLAIMNGDVDPSTETWFSYPTSGVAVELMVSPRGTVVTSRHELASQRVEAVFGKLETRYSTVVVDCPPVLAVSDSMVLAKAADVAILVVRMGKTSRRDLDKALTQLEQHQVRLAGIVTTFSTERSESYYGYGYAYGNSDDQ